MEFEPMPIDRLSFGVFEPMDPELLCLLSSTGTDSSGTVAATTKAGDIKMEEQPTVDDMMPLNVIVSTPTSVEAYSPNFSSVEMQDLMSLLLPERAADVADSSVTRPRAATTLQPKKLGKRTKKCTYAARRREVAALRGEVASLQSTLNELRRVRGSDCDWDQRAAAEAVALSKSQAENARLREVVSAREATIRTLDSYLSSLSRQR